jgi:hypothetical protein
VWNAGTTPSRIIDITETIFIVNSAPSMQAVPLFLSEIAPTRIRGGLNILFQLNVTIGILFANLVNYGTSKYVLFISCTRARSTWNRTEPN